MSMQTREQMLFDLERKAYLDLIAEARAEGERSGLERAAYREKALHDIIEACAKVLEASGYPNTAAQARQEATAIRALKVEGE